MYIQWAADSGIQSCPLWIPLFTSLVGSIHLTCPMSTTMTDLAGIQTHDLLIKGPLHN